MTYREKMELLTACLKEVYNHEGELCKDFYVCDFSDSFVIVRDFCDEKYYKIAYDLTVDGKIAFDLDGKVEQVEIFVDAPDIEMRVTTMSVDGEEKTIEDIYAMYVESNEKLNTLNGDFETYKSNVAAPVESTVTIDEVEYNLEALNQKYSDMITEKDAIIAEKESTIAEFASKEEGFASKEAELASKEAEFAAKEAEFVAKEAELSEREASLVEKETAVAEMNEKFADMEEKNCQLAEELTAAQNKIGELEEDIRMQAEEKLCGDALAMIDAEDELDKDDKECLHNKCQNHEYASLDEVENDIARILYQRKKNNRQKNFKANIVNETIVEDNAPKSVFERLQANLNK